MSSFQFHSVGITSDGYELKPKRINLNKTSILNVYFLNSANK